MLSGLSWEGFGIIVCWARCLFAKSGCLLRPSYMGAPCVAGLAVLQGVFGKLCSIVDNDVAHFRAALRSAKLPSEACLQYPH